VNPYFNTRGYLYERFFYYYALARDRDFHMGVVQDMTALHNHNPSASPLIRFSSSSVNTSASRVVTASRSKQPPRTPKHYVHQSTFHERYLKNASSCLTVLPKCLQGLSTCYKVILAKPTIMHKHTTHGFFTLLARLRTSSTTTGIGCTTLGSIPGTCLARVERVVRTMEPRQLGCT
jgi:hypothetical protein